VSQIAVGERCCSVSASSEAVAGMKAGVAPFDIETIFRAQYGRIARVIARVVRDPARAEELAVDVFLKLSRNPGAQGEQVGGWLYRTAVRMGLDELRREARRGRYERLAGFVRVSATPEEIHSAAQEQQKVRRVLGAIEPRQAELLILRSHGLSYDEVASALDLNPASVGTLLSRAQHAFRKEYLSRYGRE
jgi:RNA polymerase sigma-70 factor, ECF subfamily